jgi:RNA polymerase sigma factor (sigma-70 family)
VSINDNTDPSDISANERGEQRREYDVLIRTYSKQLFDFGFRFCQDGEIVKDCLQQLYLDLWNRGFDVAHDRRIKSYLFKAIKNRVLREKEKWSKNSPIEEGYDFVLEFGAEMSMIALEGDRELAFKLQKILNELPPRQREIIYLKFYQGLDTDQISAIMGINPQSVHNLLQKAYQNIKLDWKVLLLLLSLSSFR